MNGNINSVNQMLSALTKSRPVLILDADEVLLQFVGKLEEFLPKKEHELRVESFRLHGNIYDLNSGTLASEHRVKALLDSFFDECVDAIPAVDGTVSALTKLSEFYEIIILSNVPERCRARRQTSLAALGMPYPVIANEGAKGPVVKQIVQKTAHNITAFVDDLPPHHTSVANHSPTTHRIHFIADTRLAGFLPKAPDAHVRLNNWGEIEKNLLELAGI